MKATTEEYFEAIKNNQIWDLLPLRPWSEWWAAALTSIVRATVQAPTKAIVGANVLICLIFQKFPLPRAIRVEYGHPSSVRDYLSGHVC